MCRKLAFIFVWVCCLYAMPAFAQDTQTETQEKLYNFKDHDWNFRFNLGVTHASIYHPDTRRAFNPGVSPLVGFLVLRPQVNLMLQYRFTSFYRLGLNVNVCWELLVNGGVYVSNEFDFYRGTNVIWSARVDLGYSYIYLKYDDKEDMSNPHRKFNVHSFSTIAAVSWSYRFTDVFSFGMSLPVMFNANKYHYWFGGIALTLDFNFQFQ